MICSNKITPIDLKSVGVISLFSAEQICLSVGATIGRPRAFDERPYKTISNILMRTCLSAPFCCLKFYSVLLTAFCNDCLHFLHLAFHISHQLELGAATIQIVIFAVDAEVGASVDVVAQESHAAFQSH